MSTDFPLRAWVTHNGRRRGYITAVSATTGVLYLKDAMGSSWSALPDDCRLLPGRALQPPDEEPPKWVPTRVLRKSYGSLQQPPARIAAEIERAVEIYNAKRRLPQLGIMNGPPNDGERT